MAGVEPINNNSFQAYKPLHIGSSRVDKIYLGTTPITEGYAGSNLVYQMNEPTDFFRITNTSNQYGTITLTKGSSAPSLTLKTYRSDTGSWVTQTLTATTTFNLPEGEYMLFDGRENTGFSAYNYQWRFSCNVPHDVEGDIMSLVSGDTMASGLFYRLFDDDTELVNASGLTLPDATSERCYMYMFDGCTSLTTAPALPATTLSVRCYQEMFRGCTSLTTAPALPATTLVERCYYGMFNGCASLTAITCYATSITATLATTDWVSGVTTTGGVFTCAEGMENTWSVGDNGVPTNWVIRPPVVPVDYFTITNRTNEVGTITISLVGSALMTRLILDTTSDGVNWETSNFTSIQTFTLPANGYVSFNSQTTSFSANSLRYWTISCNKDYDISGNLMSLIANNSLTDSEFIYLFANSTTLINASGLTLSATTLATNCYYGMFQGCTSLETAPSILPATTLPGSCYSFMFKDCSSLTRGPELPATTLTKQCYNSMFNNCQSLNYIKCLATDISATNCTSMWLYNVPVTGTFVKNPNMSSWTSDYNGIPSGWTVVDA